MLQNEILQAVDILRAGGLVALPTETVYGLGADASNASAVKKIYAAKQRPADHPLIVHVADVNQLAKWAVAISDEAMLLAKTFWPGPLTLILKKAPGVDDGLTGGQDTVGLRIPAHPVALAVLKEFGGGVAAPSANRFGRISPTTAAAVREELGSAVDLILDGGQCDVGVESTIVDVSGDDPVILRPGMITAQQIEDVLHQHIRAQKKNAPRVSGSHASHYAPVTQTVLCSSADVELFLKHPVEKTIVLTWSLSQANQVFLRKMPENPHQYAHDLYQVLREIDKQNWQKIIIERVPETAEWDAIRDRLQRAAG